MSLIIKEIDYQNSKDISKLESALKNWFSNPKDLNFADPDSKYPFDMKKWINVNYKINKIRTVALYKDEWIIGFAGIKFLDDSDKAHIAQFYLDKESEGMGHKESLIKVIISPFDFSIAFVSAYFFGVITFTLSISIILIFLYVSA